jgi:hypothetical protein
MLARLMTRAADAAHMANRVVAKVLRKLERPGGPGGGLGNPGEFSVCCTKEAGAALPMGRGEGSSAPGVSLCRELTEPGLQFARLNGGAFENRPVQVGQAFLVRWKEGRLENLLAGSRLGRWSG